MHIRVNRLPVAALVAVHAQLTVVIVDPEAICAATVWAGAIIALFTAGFQVVSLHHLGCVFMPIECGIFTLRRHFIIVLRDLLGARQFLIRWAAHSQRSPPFYYLKWNFVLKLIHLRCWLWLRLCRRQPEWVFILLCAERCGHVEVIQPITTINWLKYLHCVK